LNETDEGKDLTAWKDSGYKNRAGKTGATRKMAEVHGNRTHLPSYSPGTPDLKSGRATSALSTSDCPHYLLAVNWKNNFFLLSKRQESQAYDLKPQRSHIFNGM
jgi:hypothetical protein